MQVQFYHPVGGPNLLYHYAATANGVAAASNLAAVHQPPPPHQYFTIPLILPQPQPQHHHHQPQPQHHQQQQRNPPQPTPAALAAAAAFFAAQQQQQYAGLALHFQALSVGGGANSCGSQFEAAQDRVRSASFGQADYNWKLLAWLKTHRMHKYFDRLRKYSFEQLLALDRGTLEAEQFTQGAIKKLLGMLERVRSDRSAFDAPTRSAPFSSSSSSGSSPGASPIAPSHVYQRQHQQAVYSPRQFQRSPVTTVALFPSSQLPLPQHHHQQQQQQQQQQLQYLRNSHQQQRFLCSQN